LENPFNISKEPESDKKKDVPFFAAQSEKP